MLGWLLIKTARRRGFDYKIPVKIPCAFVTGSLGKTTTCRMLASILAADGKTVALSTTQGIYIGDELIRAGDSSNCTHAYRLLAEKRANAGVFEMARGGLIQQGLAFEGCDVAAALNVYDNHLGLGGIHTREQMAEVKSAVVKAARKMAVLNADDPLCLKMRGQITAPLTCLVSMRPDNPELKAHVRDGGFAVFLDDEKEPSIKMCRGNGLIGEIPVSEIPSCYNGHFRPAIHNAMFAAALAYGMGVRFHVIRDALGKYQSNAETNPGRMNFYEHLPFRVLVSCTDGPQAVSEILHFVRGMNISGNKYLIFCAAGNRPDSFIKDSGKAAAGIFDHYICCDYEDLRGRLPFETALLLREGLAQNGIEDGRITVASSHDEGLKTALNMPSENDLLVICSLSYNSVKKELLKRKKSGDENIADI